MTRISIIVAMDDNGLIGSNNGLPWHLPNDLRFFKRTTLGKPVLMGRKTHESIGRPLPERENLILSRDPGYTAPGCRTVTTLDAAVAAAGAAPEIMVIGGAQVYALALPRTTRIYLTRVQGRFSGDAWLPTLDEDEWRVVEQQEQPADERNAYPHTFVTMDRRPSL